MRERSYELSRKLFQAHVDSRGPGEAAAPPRCGWSGKGPGANPRARPDDDLRGNPCQTFRLWSSKEIACRMPRLPPPRERYSWLSSE